MDDSITFARPTRPSALPRLSSRLPLPRSAATRGISPERPESRLDQSFSTSTTTSPTKSLSYTATLRSRPSISLLPTPSRPGGANASQLGGTVKQSAILRQPLGTIKRPQQSVVKRQHQAQPVGLKIPQHDLEEQENPYAPGGYEQTEVEYAKIEDTVNSESVMSFGSDDYSSPIVAAKKGQRPSLSDRTMLTLAQVPPTPGSSRRRSAFFNPHSPMTPARPESAMSSISKLSYGSVRKTGIAKPTPSLLGKTTRAPVGYTPRRSISTGVVPIPTMTSHAQRPNPHASSLSRPASAAPTLGRPSLLRQATATTAANTSRPAPALSRSMRAPPNRIEVRPPSQLSQSVSGIRPGTAAGRVSNIGNDTRPESRLSQSVSGVRPAGSVRRVSNIGASKATTRPAASTTLRDQIAQARTLQRNQTARPDELNDDHDIDPFKQKSKAEEAPWKQRLEVARRDGRLNIAAMGLKQIPKEVKTMFDEEPMQASSIPWNETVDLTYFSAADNEFKELSDDLFPDVSNEELAEQSRGNQFGGLETLDLHGNMLSTIPRGIRRLERLTTLNLSRNNLTNAVFDILVNLPYLRHLHLASNDLSRMVPEILGQMDSLEILDLSDNKLVLLPQSIRHLTNLRILNISSNRFSDMSLDSLAYLPHLTEIHASKNALTGSLFPSTVTLLPNLRILDVSKNSIASLTWASTNTSLSLPELMILNVSTNRLIALADLSTWTSLVTLTAEENAITILPAGFISLQRLRTANFEHNDLKVLDDDIAKMKSLEVFSVQGNPLREKRFLSMGAEVLKRELGRRAALGQEMGVDMEMKAGAAQEWVGDDEIF